MTEVRPRAHRAPPIGRAPRPGAGALALAAVLVIGTSCDSSPAGTPPETLGVTMEDVAGEYEVVRFTATQVQPREVTDLLAEGAELTLDLNVDGAMSGRLFIPGDARPLAEPSAGDLDVALGGSWSVRSTDGAVFLDFSSDVFLDAFDGFAGNVEGTIGGTHEFENVGIEVLLERR